MHWTALTEWNTLRQLFTRKFVTNITHTYASRSLYRAHVVRRRRPDISIKRPGSLAHFHRHTFSGQVCVRKTNVPELLGCAVNHAISHSRRREASLGIDWCWVLRFGSSWITRFGSIHDHEQNKMRSTYFGSQKQYYCCMSFNFIFVSKSITMPNLITWDTSMNLIQFV